jgi:hypothetical protein
MKNLYNLGDLIHPEALKQPEEGVLVVELGGNGMKAEKVDQLGETMSDFAGTIEDNKNVQVGELARLVEAMKNAMKRELLSEKAAKLLAILKKRFEAKDKQYKSAEGIKWEDVEKRLEANPAKLWSLNEMERTGGEPDLVEIDKKTGEYIFMDCSAESPTGRRNCVYDREGEAKLKKDFPRESCSSNAVSMAALMGVDILNEKEYMDLQTKGKFDRNTWSWIKTPIDRRRDGVALGGDCRGDGVRVYPHTPHTRIDDRGWRGALRV